MLSSREIRYKLSLKFYYKCTLYLRQCKICRFRLMAHVVISVLDVESYMNV